MRTSAMHALRSLIRNFFRRRHIEQDLHEEVLAHVDLLMDQHLTNGLNETEARRAARLALGGADQVKEAVRDARRGAWVEQLGRDFRYGVRGVRRNPGFTAVAIVALAAGIAVNVIVFSVANAMLVRSLPIADPGRVIRAYRDQYANVPYADYLEFRNGNTTLSSLAAFQLASVSLRASGDPEHVFGQVVSGNYFDTLGVRPSLGRMLTPADDAPGAAGAVVFSDSFWRAHFGGDPQIVGRTLTINGQPFAVAGVAPRGFTGAMAPLDAAFWIPWNSPGFAPTADQLQHRFGLSAHLIGRMRPGVRLGAVQVDLARVADRLAREYPNTNGGSTITAYHAEVMSPSFGPAPTIFVGFLAALGGLLLLVACANIASLLLARSSARRREIATRLALGAGRGRLVRQLLTEALLLSGSGGAAAVFVAFIGARAISSAVLPAPVQLALAIPFDWRVVTFAAGLSLGTTLLFGLVPALQASRAELLPALRNGTGTGGGERTRLRALLVGAQVAMSTLLLVIAGLLTRGFMSAHSLDRGFSTERVLAATVDLNTRGYTPERGAQLYEQVIQRVETIPGVLSATVVDVIPLTLSSRTSIVMKEGQDPPPDRRAMDPVLMNGVTRGHFRTLGIPLLAGRDFTAGDGADTPAVGIVNQTLARRYWPGENPVGRRVQALLRMGAVGSRIEIVGVVRDSKYATVGEAQKASLYLPLAQAYAPTGTLLVKTAGGPLSMTPQVAAQVHALDPNLAIFNVTTLEAASGVSLLPSQVAASLAGALGLAALGLAAIGLYGVMSYLVRRRTREIGIRVALGAQPRTVVSLVTRQGIRWAAAGVAVGLVASLAIARLLTSLLYGVRPLDPLTFVSIPAFLIATSYLACWIPGHRASRIDPLVALREE